MIHFAANAFCWSTVFGRGVYMDFESLGERLERIPCVVEYYDGQVPIHLRRVHPFRRKHFRFQTRSPFHIWPIVVESRE